MRLVLERKAGAEQGSFCGWFVVSSWGTATVFIFKTIHIWSNCLLIGYDSILWPFFLWDLRQEGNIWTLLKSWKCWTFILWGSGIDDEKLSEFAGIMLSGGQKQRLAVARCFLRKPRYLGQGWLQSGSLVRAIVPWSWYSSDQEIYQIYPNLRWSIRFLISKQPIPSWSRAWDGGGGRRHRNRESYTKAQYIISMSNFSFTWDGYNGTRSCRCETIRKCKAKIETERWCPSSHYHVPHKRNILSSQQSCTDMPWSSYAWCTSFKSEM